MIIVVGTYQITEEVDGKAQAKLIEYVDQMYRRIVLF